ncbi:hypothetical protein JW911_02710 [Candidatus Peregrinibacteria bacterium]|nr:hypothetical protein [Candidatus Peregrinibacteria bacterium]
MDKILFAVIGFPLSFLIIIYRANIKQFTGDLDFAEKWFGAGGTYTLILLFGIFVFFATLMYVTGSLQYVLSSTLGPLFFAK